MRLKDTFLQEPEGWVDEISQMRKVNGQKGLRRLPIRDVLGHPRLKIKICFGPHLKMPKLDQRTLKDIFMNGRHMKKVTMKCMSYIKK